MSTVFLVVLSFLTIGLLIFLLWVLIPHWKRLKRTTSNRENYYQLKYQVQYYVAIFTALIAVFTILSYDKYDDIQQKIKSDIAKKTDSIVEASRVIISEKLLETEKSQQKISIANELMKQRNEEILRSSENTNDRFYSLLIEFLNFKKDLNHSQNDLEAQVKNVEYASKRLNNLQADIEAIKKVDFLNQVYLVPNRHFEPTDGQKITDTIYFKDLITISNTRLPEFKNPPSIIISPYTGMLMVATKVTNEYYIMKGGGGTTWDDETNIEDPENWRYDLLIIYKESKE